MAMTAPFRVFPRPMHARTTSQILWGDPEQEMQRLIDEMDETPIPAMPVTKAAASITSKRAKESRKR